MSLDSIIKELPSLSATELQKLKVRIDFLTKNNKATTTTIITVERTSSLRGVIHLCAKRYIENIQDLNLIEYSNPHNLADRLESVSQAVEKMGKTLQLNRKQLMKLCQILVEAAYEKAKALNYNMSFSTLLNQMVNPRELLDANYPGYVSLPVFKTMVLG